MVNVPWCHDCDQMMVFCKCESGLDCPQGDEGPPWGIHSEDPRDAPHGAALAGDALPCLTPAILPVITHDLSDALLAWVEGGGFPEDEDEDVLPSDLASVKKGTWPAKAINPKDKAASTKVPMWSLPSIGAVHGAMSTGDGIRKNYGAYNWRFKPISMMEHIGALERHIAALKDGEDFTRDSDFRITHLGCLIAGATIILDAQQFGTLIDDRPVTEPNICPAADALENYHDHHSKS